MARRSRRSFLRESAQLATASAFVPGWLSCSAARLDPAQARKRLIVVQLSGGNDGLNVLAPVGDPAYAALRPTIALRAPEAIRIDATLAWNPAVPALAALQDQGHLHVIQGVGYPNAHRSHFRSMDVWQSGSVNVSAQSTGWLGRYLDSECAGEPSHTALHMGNDLPLALRGENQAGYAYGNLRRAAALLQRVDTTPIKEIPTDAYVSKLLTDTRVSTRYLLAQQRRSPSVRGFTTTPFGRQLQDIARLVRSDAQTSIYYASLTGFDTHARQNVRHGRLLSDYSTSINALVETLKHDGTFADTLILTFSEFGRRLQQNKNGGTDHGKANLAWLIGGAVRPNSLSNLRPNLERDDDGDLAMQVDFRSIYATILARWLDVNPRPLVGSHPLLDFI